MFPSWMIWRASQNCSVSRIKVVTFCNYLVWVRRHDFWYCVTRVENCQESWDLQANRCASHHFMDAGRRPLGWGTQNNSLLLAAAVARVSPFSWQFLQGLVPKERHNEGADDTCQGWVTEEEPQSRGTFCNGLQANLLSDPEGEIIFIFQVCSSCRHSWKDGERSWGDSGGGLKMLMILMKGATTGHYWCLLDTMPFTCVFLLKPRSTPMR